MQQVIHNKTALPSIQINNIQVLIPVKVEYWVFIVVELNAQIWFLISRIMRF
jgi:hypothetical protein